MQQELVRMVAEKARSAAETVIGYLKNNLPAGVSSQLDNVASGASAGSIGNMAEGIGNKFK